MTRFHAKALSVLLSLMLALGMLPAPAFAKVAEETMGEEPMPAETTGTARPADDRIPVESTAGAELTPEVGQLAETERAAVSEPASEPEPAADANLAAEAEQGFEGQLDNVSVIDGQGEETDSGLQVQATTNAYARSAYIGYIKAAARESSFGMASYYYADVYGDETDEALVVYKSRQGSGSYLQIFTYANNSVRRLLNTGIYGDIDYSFCKALSSFVLHRGGHGGEMYEYFQTSGGTYVRKAYRSRQSTSYGGRTDTEWGYYDSDGNSLSLYDFNTRVTCLLAVGPFLNVSGSASWPSMGANDRVLDPVTGFYDVRGNHWAAAVIERASKLGLISGYENGNFGPENPISRGQVAVVLWNLAGKPSAGSGAKNFPDVKTSDYFYNAVRWASSKGVVSGYSGGNFGPNDNVTREQLAVMLASYVRYVKGGKITGSSSDYASMGDRWKVSSWAVSSVGWCFRNKLLTGSNGSLLPQGNATRAQAAKMVVGLRDMFG